MKLKSFVLFILVGLTFNQCLYSQGLERPKLVVGIVIDQMRYDYLCKYSKYYGDGGFKRLMNEGTNFTFAHYNYVPTFTAPGHASIYTGTTPFYHGIISNDWYDKVSKKSIYCVSDSSMKSVGSNDNMGQMSPKRLLSTTMTDQLKLATHMVSKVIGVSLKDRAAILPAGHIADGAYWYDSKTGDFISSSYYMKSLPSWVNDFNNRKLADKYIAAGWKLSHPVDDYSISDPDESSHEYDVFSEGKTSFPHSCDKLKAEQKYGALESTPYGNEIVKEMAKAALVNENLGGGTETDFLAISFSSTDFVGHAYGTNAYETEDIYLKLDEQLADLLNALDKRVGKGNYLLFLTADHAGLDTPGYLKDRRLPTGGLDYRISKDSLKAFSRRTYGTEKIMENYGINQIIIDRALLRSLKLNIHDVMRAYADYLRESFPEIQSIFTRDDLEGSVAFRENANLTMNGFNPVLSGDIAFTLRPGYLPGFMNKGTTHGAPYSYDTHVPMLFYGWHVPVQTSCRPVYSIDIAATITNLLHVTEPSASMGVPLIGQ